ERRAKWARGQVAETLQRLATGVHALRAEESVARHAVDTVGDARHARVQATQTGAERRWSARDRIGAGVLAGSSSASAHNCPLLGPFGEVRECRAEGHAWKRGGDLPIDAANLDRRTHLRIESLELRRPAEQVQKDDRLVGGDGFVPGR